MATKPERQFSLANVTSSNVGIHQSGQIFFPGKGFRFLFLYQENLFLGSKSGLRRSATLAQVLALGDKFPSTLELSTFKNGQSSKKLN